MRTRIALVLGLVAALALGAMSLSQAGSGFKVTGGGQTDVGTTGAGDTIAFTAQKNPSQGVTGQVQFVDRADGTGRGQTVFHGTVVCLEAVDAGEQGAAIFAGFFRNNGGSFEIYVEDNGEPNQGNDVVFLDRTSPPNCDDEEDDDGRTALGRGNVQVHSTE